MLKQISIEGFARFISDRMKYEKEINEKKKDDSVDIMPASYLVSMSPLLLKTLWQLKHIDVPKCDAITADHVGMAIEKKAVRESGDIDLFGTEMVVGKVEMKMNISEWKGRIAALVHDHSYALKALAMRASRPSIRR